VEPLASFSSFWVTFLSEPLGFQDSLRHD